MQNIREKLKRRVSHKDENVNFDEHESADEDTVEHVGKEADEAEKEGYESGRPGSFLNRLISHGNKKTEDQLAREAAASQAQAQAGSTATQAGGADNVVR